MENKTEPQEQGKHTPGTRRIWILSDTTDLRYLDSEASARLMTDEQAEAANSLIVEGNPWRWYPVGTPSESTAAPDLLAALKALMAMDVNGHALQDRLQFSPEGRAILEPALAAIAKAEGK